MLKQFLQISLLIFLFSCSSDQTKIKHKNYFVSSGNSAVDTLYKLLGRTAALDSFEFNPSPYLYIKTGNILSGKTKNAVLIYSKDSSEFYSIELYSLIDNKWERKDSIDSLEIFPAEFYVNYVDYNFDDYKDIFFQKSISNGIPLSYGYLFTVDPTTNKIKEHPEFLKIANAKADRKNKKIISVSLAEGEYADSSTVCILTNEWRNDTLKTIKKDCPPCNPSK